MQTCLLPATSKSQVKMCNMFKRWLYLSAPYKMLVFKDALGVTCWTVYISKVTVTDQTPCDSWAFPIGKQIIFLKKVELCLWRPDNKGVRHAWGSLKVITMAKLSPWPVQSSWARRPGVGHSGGCDWVLHSASLEWLLLQFIKSLEIASDRNLTHRGIM